MWRISLVMLFFAAGCDTLGGSEDSHGVQNDAAASDCMPESSPCGCIKEVVAKVTFWKSTSWGAKIYCDGAEMTLEGLKEGESISYEDIGPDNCDGPGVFSFTYKFEYVGGMCEYCSSSADSVFCVPLAGSCEQEYLEVTASGSEEGGVQPMFCCPGDQSCD
jgi:hypothetical protein